MRVCDSRMERRRKEEGCERASPVESIHSQCQDARDANPFVVKPNDRTTVTTASVGRRLSFWTQETNSRWMIG